MGGLGLGRVEPKENDAVATLQLYNMAIEMIPKPECSSCIPGGISVRLCAPQGSSGRGPGSACCGNGRCDGHEMGHTCPQDCLRDDLSLVQTQVGDKSNSYESQAMLRWRPTRGMEGRSLLMCVGARAVMQGEFDSIIQERNANNGASARGLLLSSRAW